MDLGAYINIENLEEKIKAQGIEVPRLRGYRLMSEESPVTGEEIEAEKNYSYLLNIRELIRYGWRIKGGWILDYEDTDEKLKRYAVVERDEDSIETLVRIKWENIHGKKRKALRYLNKQSDKAIEENYAMFNKYIGQKDVLYIHARLGGISCKDDCSNWGGYNCDEIIKKQPWFLDAVDDSFDQTYCDIYAKIDEDLLKNS